ncbi:hypothetical protein Droror1_Dr00024246 [Drosera rotundifolia]
MFEIGGSCKECIYKLAHPPPSPLGGCYHRRLRHWEMLSSSPSSPGDDADAAFITGRCCNRRLRHRERRKREEKRRRLYEGK